MNSLSHPALAPITDLLAQDGDFDEDFVRPTDRAVEAATDLLVAAWNSRLGNLPRYCATALGDGTLRLHFYHETKGLRVVFRCDETLADYIYHRHGDERGTDIDTSPESFVRWFEWLEIEGTIGYE